VGDNYFSVSGLDSMIIEGTADLQNNYGSNAIIGQGIKVFLNVILNSPRQMVMYAPRRLSQMPLDPSQALTRRYLQPSGVFSIEQDFDTRYIIVRLSFARDLFDYKNGEISTIEVKTGKGYRTAGVQSAIKEFLGSRFVVQNRYEQNEIFYKTMQTEKWAIFLILIFILAVASFNVIGTLTMLILEKKKDIITLRNLGADTRLIKRIFMLEGWLISAIGAVFGIIAGLLVCWVQIRFEPVKLQGSGSFIIDAYPVLVRAADVFITFGVVLAVGFFAAWYPIRYLSQNYISELNGN
jgi:lipoprotein-releasing system permease protein